MAKEMVRSYCVSFYKPMAKGQWNLFQSLYQSWLEFPSEEPSAYGQLRRDGMWITSNIAEGQGRLGRKEFQHFLGNARGSLWEVETQILSPEILIIP